MKRQPRKKVPTGPEAWRRLMLAAYKEIRGDEVRGRFKKGHATWNKGLKGIHLSPRTEFKKGGKPLNTWVPVGSTTLDKDGVLKLKVKESRVRHRAWIPFHRLVWESWFGRVPRGRIVVFADRDQRNTRIENLLCITRAENMERNSYHRYPQPIPQLIQLRGAINRQINKRAA